MLLLKICDNMTHYEYEGKELFRKVGIEVPFGIVFDSVHEIEEFLSEHLPVAVKAQVLSGKRGKSGGIKLCNSKDDALAAVSNILGMEINGEKVSKVLIEKKLDIVKEFYLSVCYDTWVRSPVLMVSVNGGIDVENNAEMKKLKLDMNNQVCKDDVCEFISGIGFDEFSGDIVENASSVCVKLIECFNKFDCRLAEINPLVLTKQGQLIAADSKIIIDEDAMFRQKDLGFEEHSVNGQLTKLESDARKIDEGDHRGTAGSTFIELDGDIAILASGGGASVTCMDSLVALGGEPANYTEYSGNPPDYKVKALTKVTLSKKGINGLWVCGGTANFTDIYETLKGFLDGLREVLPKPDYPIVIRRAGPRDDEAFKILREAIKQDGWDMYLFGNETPMTKSAEILIEKVEAYKKIKMNNVDGEGQ